MRPGYSVTDADGGVESHEIDIDDVRTIIAEHFGVDPENVRLDGLEIPDGTALVTVRRNPLPLPPRR